MWRRARESTVTLERVDDPGSMLDDEFTRDVMLTLVDDAVRAVRGRDVLTSTEASDILARLEHGLLDDGVPADALAVVRRATCDANTQAVVAAAGLVNALLDIRLALA